MTTTPKANRYGGRCDECRAWIEPEKGLLTGSRAQGWGVRHDGECPEQEAPEFAEPGYYTTQGVYLVVVNNRAGNATYAKRLEQTDKGRWRWNYAPGVGRTLAGLTPLTLEEATAWGHLHGFCIICCRALTDPISVQRGIGPVCAAKLDGPIATQGRRAYDQAKPAPAPEAEKPANPDACTPGDACDGSWLHLCSKHSWEYQNKYGRAYNE